MAGIVAFLAEGIGVAIGMILYSCFDIKDKRMIGGLFGITSGIMLAIICFDILPEAMVTSSKNIVIGAVLIGVIIGLYLQNIINNITDKLGKKGMYLKGTGIIMLVGIAIHNIPEGVALGTLMKSSPESVVRFASIIALHSVPEAIALAIPLKMSGISTKQMVCIPIMLGAIMGVGAEIGAILSGLTSQLMAISLGVAAGVILYIVCEELLPESRKIWNGRMTSISIIIGIILGIMLVA